MGSEAENIYEIEFSPDELVEFFGRLEDEEGDYSIEVGHFELKHQNNSQAGMIAETHYEMGGASWFGVVLEYDGRIEIQDLKSGVRIEEDPLSFEPRSLNEFYASCSNRDEGRMETRITGETYVENPVDITETDYSLETPGFQRMFRYQRDRL